MLNDMLKTIHKGNLTINFNKELKFKSWPNYILNIILNIVI